MKLIMENWKKFLQERGFAPPMPGEKLNRRTKNQTGPQGAANALEHDWSKLGRQARIEIEEGLIGKSGRSGVRIIVVGASEQDLEELKSMVSKITAEQDLESDVELSKEGENHVFSLMQKVDLNLEQFNMDSSMELERKMEEVDGKRYVVVIVSGPKGKAEGRSNPVKNSRAISRQTDRAKRRAIEAYHKL